jgi:hypothetical protein
MSKQRHRNANVCTVAQQILSIQRKSVKKHISSYAISKQNCHFNVSVNVKQKPL